MKGAPYRVTILAERVEELCDLWRALVDEKGVPAEAIGLYHRKAYREDKADDARHGRLSEKDAQRYASLPATRDWQSRPILLTTHQRLKLDGVDRIGPNYYRTPDGGVGERDVMIWDESLLVTSSRAMRLVDIESALRWLEPHASTSPEDVREDFEAAVAWLRGEFERLDVAAKRRDRSKLTLSPLETPDALVRAVKKTVGKSSRAAYGVLGDFKRLVQFAGCDATVYTEEVEKALVQFDVKIPDALSRVIVLDASWRLRLLTRLKGGEDRPTLTEAWPTRITTAS